MSAWNLGRPGTKVSHLVIFASDRLDDFRVNVSCKFYIFYRKFTSLIIAPRIQFKIGNSIQNWSLNSKLVNLGGWLTYFLEPTVCILTLPEKPTLPFLLLAAVRTRQNGKRLPDQIARMVMIRVQL